MQHNYDLLSNIVIIPSIIYKVSLYKKIVQRPDL